MTNRELRETLQDTLGTAYMLERELGGGGMSRVFVARETALDRLVVIKVLSPELAAGVNVERFRREIMLAARLQHPHIVPLLTAGESTGLPYFTMPFIDGESLRGRITRTGELPVNEVVRVLREVASALAYAHGRGIVHRDIKPDNVLLSGCHALVVDFGVAKALSVATVGNASGLSSIGIALGTPAYMAPEQGAADPATDHRADLYALGVTAYEMLTGCPPFSGLAPQALLAAHATMPVPPVRERRTATPPALAAVVMGCLEKRPADRPQSADDILRVLESITTPSGGTVPRAEPESVTSIRRRNGLWGLGMVAAAAIGVAAVMATRSRMASNESGSAGARTESVAVLPFVNVEHDTAAEYLGDGIADELTTTLATVPGLRVAARSSAFTFRGQNVGAQDVGQKLHVAAVLEGTVQRAGGRLRVTTQLVHTSDGLAVWSDSYERQLADVFQVEDELARDIALALSKTIGGGRSDSAAAGRVAAVHAPRGTTDLAAYDLFLQGRHFFAKRGATALWRAVSLFQQALARDSNFARADASLAMCYDLLPQYGGARADSVLPLAEKSAGRALALDSGLAEAHLVLGDVRIHQWRWADAERELGQSVELEPSNPTVHLWHADLLLGLGEVQQALGHARMAYGMDPLTPASSQTLAEVLLDARRFNEAAAAARRGLALDSTLTGLRQTLIEAYLFGGQPDSAVAVADRALASNDTSARLVSAATWAYARTGRRPEAQILLARLRRGSASESTPALDMAAAHMALGNTDSAIVWVGRSVARHDAEPVWDGLACDPIYDGLKRDPRFEALMRPTGMRLCSNQVSTEAKGT